MYYSVYVISWEERYEINVNLNWNEKVFIVQFNNTIHCSSWPPTSQIIHTSSPRHSPALVLSLSSRALRSLCNARHSFSKRTTLLRLSLASRSWCVFWKTFTEQPFILDPSQNRHEKKFFSRVRRRVYLPNISGLVYNWRFIMAGTTNNQSIYTYISILSLLKWYNLQGNSRPR